MFPEWAVVLWLVAIAVPVVLVLASFWLADRGWYALCRVLKRRGWDIKADDTPLTNV